MIQTYPIPARPAARPMSATPVAYIRRSVSRRGDPGDVSREFQTREVRALAGADGIALRVLDGDWGVSADREKTSQRLDFLGLIAAVERGEVSAVYAFALDRLARSVQWSSRLLDACEDAGTVIVTGEGRFDPANDRDRQMVHFFAMQNEGALRAMKTKARASVATRKDRGEKMGQRPYGERRTLRDGRVVGADEDAGLILATYREAGSYFAAARLLNERGVPTQGGRGWFPSTVLRIVNRLDPATKRHGRSGSKASSPLHRLSGLLVCACGAQMGRTVSGEGTPRYRCSTAAADPSHPRPYIVPEKRLMPLVMAEAARLRLPEVVETTATDEAKRAAILRQREGFGDSYAAGAYGPVGSADAKAAMTSRLAALDAEQDALEAKRQVMALPPDIDWSWPPEQVNAVLRALWEYVKLGPDLMPVEFKWRVPEWMAD